jgi:DNA invertase Pin-like site-specific DNA recombinase
MVVIAAYIRVSTVGQNEAGQRAEIEKWLKGHGIDPATVLWYVDHETGDNLDRPEFKRLQKDVFNGTVKTVVVWKLDRLSRSLQDGINTLCDWLGSGIRLVSVTQQLDFAGPTGKLIAAVLFAVAEMEQQTRRERQAAGIAVAKQEGKYRGRRPGSRNKVDGKANKPERARKLRDKGRTLEEIAKTMGVCRMTVHRWLKSESV